MHLQTQYLATFSTLFLLVSSYDVTQVGLCDLTTLPTTWLLTSAIGIPNWGTAGIPLGGNNFCLSGNTTAETVKVAYHVATSSLINRRVQSTKSIMDTNNKNNGCILKDPRIQYCIPFCDDEKQKQAIYSALLSSDPVEVATDLSKHLYNNQTAVTVLNVDYNNPETHLNISSFLDPAWCSVYIGINPNQGTPYLFEIQVARIIT